MAFDKKVWFDRETEYPNRRVFTPVGSGGAQQYYVERDEGIIYEEGDAFDADTMNGLEERIEAALAEKMEASDTVKNAQQLGGRAASYYASAGELTLVKSTANSAYSNAGMASAVADNAQKTADNAWNLANSRLNAAQPVAMGPMTLNGDGGSQFSGRLTWHNFGKQCYVYITNETDTMPHYAFSFNSEATFGFLFRNMPGNAYLPVYASNTTQPSSRRYKDVLGETAEADVLKLLDCVVKDFTYKKGGMFYDGRVQHGLIAEELEQIDSSYLYYGEAGQVEGINYTKMVPALLKLLQLQQKRIDALQEDVSHAL